KFKAGDVIVWTQDLIDKQFERTRTLGKTHDEIMLQPLIQQRELLDFAHPVDVVIAPADDADNGFSLNLVCVEIKGRYSQRARRFSHNGIFVIQFEDGRAYLAFGYEMHIVQ